ncbi:MAG: hypothetical protein WCP87_00260 [Atribacterota bacterium]
MIRKQWWSLALVALVCLGMSGLVLGNEKMNSGSTPTLLPWEEVFTTKEGTTDLRFPVVQGMNDKDIEQRINSEIATMVEEFREPSELRHSTAQLFTVEYETPLFTDKVLSIRWNITARDKGFNHSYHQVYGLVLDIVNGKVLDIPDLVGARIDILDVLNRLIQKKASDTGLLAKTKVPLLTVNMIQIRYPYYLTDHGLVIYFPGYATSDETPIEIELSYLELQGLIRFKKSPDEALWKHDLPLPTMRPEGRPIMNEFTSLLLKKNVSGKEVIRFIEKNTLQVSIESSTDMVLFLEEVLQKNLSREQDKFSPDSVQEKIIRSLGMVSDHELVNAIDSLADPHLKMLFRYTFENGYRIVVEEGFRYPIIDYLRFKKFPATPDIRAYIDIMASESEQMREGDAALLITWDKLLLRALRSELYLRQFPLSPRRAAVKELFLDYLRVLFFGENNTPTFDYIDNILVPEVQKIYTELAQYQSESVITTAIREYLPVLKRNKWLLTNEAEKIRNELFDKLGKSTFLEIP